MSWDAAYEAIINDAENQPQDWRVQGRGGLKSWREVGYVPYDDNEPGGLNTRSISRTVEVSWLITLNVSTWLMLAAVCIQ